MIDDANLTLADGAHRQLGLIEDAQLAYHYHIQRSSQRLGDLQRDGHSTPGKTQHHDVLAPQVPQVLGQLSSGVNPVVNLRPTSNVILFAKRPPPVGEKDPCPASVPIR